MAYFSPHYIDFFKGLAVNNHKAWFDEHRAEYEQYVKEPFKAFTADLLLRLRLHDREIHPEVKDCIFRINRDIRFAANKEPYKLHLGAIAGKFGRRNLWYPSFYYEFRADALMFAAGIYFPPAKVVHQVREHFAQFPEALEQLLQDKDFQVHYGSLKGEKNKSIPAVFREAARNQPLLYHKEFYVMAEVPAEKLLEEQLPELLESYFKAALPLNNYLKGAFQNQD